MAEKPKILIVDDDEDILIAGKLLLRRHDFDVITCHQPDNIPRILNDNSFQAILLDMNFGPGESTGSQGLKWLNGILSIEPDSVVVMITAHAGMNLAIKAMKQGATDFVTKPWVNEKLVATVSTAASLGSVKKEAKQLRTTNKLLTQVANNTTRPQILGDSEALKNVMSLVKRSAPTDANVLILGENGTGKELIARELHVQSNRCDSIFLTVDLGAISETLFESELFGHKKGAFTGANEERVGKIEAANGGTLFFDELGNLPLHLQAKLLSVLEQRHVTPLGANKAKPFDVRIICATNASPHTLRDENKFRQDLLFRLNTVEITLPPLRDRPGDINQIAQYYLDYYSKKYHKSVKKLSDTAQTHIRNHPWPGNIRALRHAIERAVIMNDTAQLEVDDFQLDNPVIGHASMHKDDHLVGSASYTQQTARPTGSQKFAQENMLQHTPEPYDQNNLNLEHIEKQTITKALRTYRYNISHTAKALGLTRAALYRRMEKHGL